MTTCSEATVSFEGKHALIVGASNETGPAVARAFAQRGARLALTYHSDRAAAETVAAQCRGLGAPEAHVMQLDLLNSAQCESFIAAVRRTLGGIDFLLAVAGAGGSYRSLLEIEPQEMREAFQGQVCGNFTLARDAGLIMPTDGSGRIVFLSATSSHKFSHGTYGYAKATLNQLTAFLAYELATRKITVNTLVPQLIDLESIDPAVREKRKRYTPLGLIPHPDQIAGFCVTLCSPGFNIATGELIHLDGGYRLRPPEDR
jgi:NAD(P)-dependent dehydrogenase (short-subunit alcohol dehydrogenase family)